MRTLCTIALAWLLAVPLATQAQNRAGLPPDEVGRINEVTDAFAKAVLARDWKAVAALYVEDGVLYPPGEAAVRGRQGIEACLAGLPALSDLRLRNLRVDGRDDLAYIEGTYTFAIATPDAPDRIEESGYFLEIRRRQPDGRWLIAVHMLRPH
jgi:uncharacterized protein (TIGR02246 family)